MINKLRPDLLSQFREDVQEQFHLEAAELSLHRHHEEQEEEDKEESSKLIAGLKFWKCILTVVDWGVSRKKSDDDGVSKYMEKGLAGMMDRIDEVEASADAQLLAAHADPSIDAEFWLAVKERVPYFRALQEIDRVYNEATKAPGVKLVDVSFKVLEERFDSESAEDKCNNAAPTGDIDEIYSRLASTDYGSRTAALPLQEDDTHADESNRIFDKIVEKEQSQGECVEERCFYSIEPEPQEGMRQPRFINREKSAYEWNRYNQAHYDQDNPPPLTVQGYKFILCYANLKPTSPTPTWRLLPAEDPSMVYIRFHASEPYEDVQFKILSKRWELNPKRGFKNTFEKGIFYLHFTFKRSRYRK